MNRIGDQSARQGYLNINSGLTMAEVVENPEKWALRARGDLLVRVSSRDEKYPNIRIYDGINISIPNMITVRTDAAFSQSDPNIQGPFNWLMRRVLAPLAERLPTNV